jgi:transposase
MRQGMPADPNCSGCQESAKVIAGLEARVKSLEDMVERLLGRIDELERAGKRQAGPFSKGDPKPNPKRPGRKSGDDHGTHAFRAVPEHIDETIPVELPACCPDCGGRLDELQVADQYQTDLPPVRPITRRFRVHVGCCRDCGRRVQPRHPLQTSDALGAAAVQLGPNALSFATALNKVYGPSWTKVAHLIDKAFGLKASASAYCRASLRLGDRLGPTYEVLKKAVATSPIVYPDETGWRVGGHRRWLWVFVAANVTVYRIAPSRGGEVAEEILGAHFAGVLGRDGWAAYRRFVEALHQSCLGHHMRRAHEILLIAKQGAAKFAHAVLRVFKAALDLRDRRDALSPHGLAVARGKIETKLDWVLSWRPKWPLNARFAKHLVNERDHLLTFLRVPGLEATNWPAEQAIRPAVIARKLSGCNRTDRGASAQERITSVARTARQQNRDVFDLFARVFRASEPLDLALVPEPG